MRAPNLRATGIRSSCAAWRSSSLRVSATTTQARLQMLSPQVSQASGVLGDVSYDGSNAPRSFLLDAVYELSSHGAGGSAPRILAWYIAASSFLV